jgi:hypothetical protein
MSYQAIGLAALGAGPGPVKKYLVDLPFPWGDDTEVTVPMQQFVTDAVASVPLEQLAIQFVESGWPTLKSKIEADGPEIVSMALEPKLGEAKYYVNQLMGEADKIARRTVIHAYIAAGLAVVGIWWAVRRKKS